MIAKFSHAEVSQISFIAGDDFELQLGFDSDSELLSTISNVSVNLVRVEKERNQFAFGFGVKPQVNGNLVTATQKLDAALIPGLYGVGAASLCWENEPNKNQTIHFDPSTLP